MLNKPTYEELERRLKSLEKQFQDCKDAEDARCR
jgi:hypothetical protein